jgi:predicted aspartyl protease
LDDFFSIPKSLADELGIAELKEAEVQLGNGDQVTVDVGICELILPFSSEVLVMNVIIDEDDECLIGMSLLSEICSSFEINFEQEIIRLQGLKI